MIATRVKAGRAETGMLAQVQWPTDNAGTMRDALGQPFDGVNGDLIPSVLPGRAKTRTLTPCLQTAVSTCAYTATLQDGSRVSAFGAQSRETLGRANDQLTIDAAQVTEFDAVIAESARRTGPPAHRP